MYFHILELKNNGISAELQGSADRRGAVQFLTQCFCVSQRPEVLTDSEAICDIDRKNESNPGDTGQEKGKGRVSKPPALSYEFTSERQKTGNIHRVAEQLCH